MGSHWHSRVEGVQWWAPFLIGRLLTLPVEKRWEEITGAGNHCQNSPGGKHTWGRGRWQGQGDGIKARRPPHRQATLRGIGDVLTIKTKDILLFWITMEVDPKKRIWTQFIWKMISRNNSRHNMREREGSPQQVYSIKPVTHVGNWRSVLLEMSGWQ